MQTPLVYTRSTWVDDDSIYIEGWFDPRDYVPPAGTTTIWAQIRKKGASTWDGLAGYPITEYTEEVFVASPLYVIDRTCWYEVRIGVTYNGSSVHGATLEVYMPGENEPYVGTGSAHRTAPTTGSVIAIGDPGSPGSGNLFVQYRPVSTGVWTNTASIAITAYAYEVFNLIGLDAGLNYEVRAVLSDLPGWATLYGAIVLLEAEPDSFECETKPSGAGTEANPYIITDICKLNWIGGDSVPDPKANRLVAWYELGNDIDASETSQWYWSNSRGVYEGFRPIGNSTTPFTGSFDGKGYTIYGLYIDSSRTDGVGLFGQMDGALALQNVYFRNVTVRGLYRAHPYGVGVVVGQMLNLGSGLTKPISNIRVTGADVEGLSYTGGIVGRIAIKVAMQDCSFQGKIIASGSSTGGIAGYVDHNTPNVATYQRLWSSVTIIAETEVGGLFGWFRAIGDPSLFQSFSVGTIKARTTAGGLVGTTYSGTHSNTHIKDCYSRVNVEITSTLSTAWAAGLLSRLDADRNHRVTNSYSTGTVTVSGSANAKGLIGYHIGGTDLSLIINSFWDTQTSGQATSNGGTGKTTAQMKTKATFTDAGWDFVTIWDIDGWTNDGYPFLRNVTPIVTVRSPILIIEYEAPTIAVAPKLIIEHQAPEPAVAPKLIIEHEYLIPIAPKLIVEHEAAAIAVAPKLIIEHEAPADPAAPKLIIEHQPSPPPEELTRGIQIFIYGTWTDIGDYVMQFTTKRGRMHELDRVEAGTAVIVLNNEDGRFWRYNTGSPYFSQIKPIIRVRIIMEHEIDIYSVFNGVIEAWRPGWLGNRAGGTPIMTIEAADMFKRFSRAYIRTTEPWPVELSGTRIIRVLSHIGWPAGADWRQIDPGTVMISALDASVTPVNALDHLLDVAQAEGGLFFMDVNSKAVFQDSEARTKGEYSYVKATLTKNDMLPMQLSDDDSMIFTAAQINKVYYEMAETPDPLIGKREFVESYPLAMETDAMVRAYQIVERYKESLLRLPALPLVPAENPSRLWPMVLGYDLSTKIRVQLDDPQFPAKIDQVYHIEGIQHDWDAVSDLWRTHWQVWDVSQFRACPSTNFDYCGGFISPVYNTAHAHQGKDVSNNPGSVDIGHFRALQNWYIGRSLLEIDTTAVTGGISEATLFVRMVGRAHYDEDQTYRPFKIMAVEHRGLSCPLQITDYGALRMAMALWGESDTITTVLHKGWIAIPLNSEGIYNIIRGGITRIALRINWERAVDPGEMTYRDSERVRLAGVTPFYVYGEDDIDAPPYMVIKLSS